MKKASVILSHLRNQPQFKYLKQEQCYIKFISLLGKKWENAIAFVYIKNNTLFVAVTHPGFKMELNYNRDLLKRVLTQMASLDESCKMLQADKVVVFHSKYRSIIKEEATEESTIPYYTELSDASFDIQSEDEEIIAQYEKIRDTIKKLQSCKSTEL